MQAGENSPGSSLIHIMNARSKYRVAVESENLVLSYELNEAPRMYRLPFEALPLGNFSRWWLYGGPSRAYTSGILAIDFIRGAENQTQRPVTQREAEALAFYASKKAMYGIMGNVTGLAAGGVIAWMTREKMKFPFIAAKPLERYNRFPLQNAPILHGRHAQIAWQITRANVWAMLCVLVSGPLFASMGNGSTLLGITRDERTQGLVNEWRQKGSMDRISSNLPQEKGSRPQTQVRGGQYTESDPYNRDIERENAPDYPADRDYNQGGPYADARIDSAMSNDPSNQIREGGQPSSGFGGISSYGKPPPAPTMQPQDRSRQDDPDPFFYDDASPTAGNDPNMSTPAAYSRPTGSVWERIRKGNAPDRSTPTYEPGSLRGTTAEDPKDDPATQESRGSGAGTYEALHGREQAQKEFDDMLDRERRQSGSDEYDRGMKAVESGQESNADSGMSAWERRRRDH